MRADYQLTVFNNKRRAVDINFYIKDKIVSSKHYENILPLANKKDGLMSFIKDILDKYPKVDEKFSDMIYHYIDAKEKDDDAAAYKIIIEFLKFLDENIIDKYIEDINLKEQILFREPIVSTKKKNVITLTKDDVLNFYKVSLLIRFYALIYIIKDIALSKELDDKVFKYILKRVRDTGALNKLDNIVRAKIFTNINDHKLSEIWKYLNINRGIEPYVYAIKIFNFIIRTVLPSLKLESNEKGKRNFLGYINANIKTNIDFLLKNKGDYLLVISEINDTYYTADNEKELMVMGLTDTLISTILKQTFIKNISALKSVKFNLRVSSPSVMYISQPLTNKLLDLKKVYDLPMDVTKLFNLFWMSELLKMDPELVEMRKILAGYSVPLKVDEEVFNDISKVLPQLVNNIYRHYPIKSIHKQTYVKSVLVRTLENMMSYKYINLFKKYTIKVNWGKFCSEYIRFASYLSIGKYDDHINKLKQKFRISS